MYNEVLKDTWNQLVANREALLRALLIPSLILLFLEYLLPSGNINNSISFSSLILLLISVIVYLYIAITVHRVLIMGPESVSRWGNFGFSTKRELAYFFKMIILGLIIGVFVFFLMLLGSAFGSWMILFIVATAVVAAIFVSRLSLVFPATAIEEELSFSDSWRLTSKYKLLTFVTIVFFPVLLSVLVGGIYGLVIEFLMKGISPYLSILVVPLNVFINVLTIACLSSTYAYIRKENLDFFEPEKILAREVETIRSETTVKKLIDVKHDVTFEGLKQELILQYEPLGFIKTVIDKADSWMVKNPELGSAYVLLSLKDDNYVIESYNIEEPKLEVI